MTQSGGGVTQPSIAAHVCLRRALNAAYVNDALTILKHLDFAGVQLAVEICEVKQVRVIYLYGRNVSVCVIEANNGNLGAVRHAERRGGEISCRYRGFQDLKQPSGLFEVTPRRSACR